MRPQELSFLGEVMDRAVALLQELLIGHSGCPLMLRFMGMGKGQALSATCENAAHIPESYVCARSTAPGSPSPIRVGNLQLLAKKESTYYYCWAITISRRTKEQILLFFAKKKQIVQGCRCTSTNSTYDQIAASRQINSIQPLIHIASPRA